MEEKASQKVEKEVITEYFMMNQEQPTTSKQLPMDFDLDQIMSEQTLEQAEQQRRERAAKKRELDRLRRDNNNFVSAMSQANKRQGTVVVQEDVSIQEMISIDEAKK